MRTYVVSYMVAGDPETKFRDVIAHTARHAEIQIAAELAADKGGRVFSVRWKHARPSRGNR